MTRLSRNLLLLGTAILALNACGTKGPGDIGSKDDIVVKNNGLPQAQQQAAIKAEGEDFTSTVEQAEAIPVAEVASAEPLPDTSPTLEAAVAQHAAAKPPIARIGGSTAVGQQDPGARGVRIVEQDGVGGQGKIGLVGDFQLLGGAIEGAQE